MTNTIEIKQNQFKDSLKEMMLFSWPLIIGQMGQMLFSIGDIMVASRYSTDVVAGIGLASGIFAPFLLVGLGTTFAIGPMMAQSLGRKEENKALLPNGLTVAFIVSLILTVLALVLYFNFHRFGFESNLEKLAKSYFLLVIPSLFPLMVYQAFKEVLQAYHFTIFANALILIMNVVSVCLNFIFIWGYGPIPELGIEGAAISTTICRVLMALIIMVYAIKKINFDWKLNLKLSKEIAHFGVPISIGVLVEVMVFSTVTILVGKMTILATAAHNISLNYSGLAFMIPMAIGSSAAVKVGHAYGAKNLSLLKYSAAAALTLSLIVMLMSAAVFWFLPEAIFRMSTTDQELIDYGKRLLFFVAIFQIPDGLQITLWGILRGIGVTKVPMVLSFVANWLIGFPVGVYLAFNMNMEAAGLWAGLTVGLMCICVSLMFLLSIHYKKIKKRFTEKSFIPFMSEI